MEWAGRSVSVHYSLTNLHVHLDGGLDTRLNIHNSTLETI